MDKVYVHSDGIGELTFVARKDKYAAVTDLLVEFVRVSPAVRWCLVLCLTGRY